eukprot:193211-Pleurochrysis_carterae.AAC.3
MRWVLVMGNGSRSGGPAGATRAVCPGRPWVARPAAALLLGVPFRAGVAHAGAGAFICHANFTASS